MNYFLTPINLGRIINIIVLTLAFYSIYIKLISKFDNGNILRETWILLCGVVSFFDIFILKIVPIGNIFVICNKIQLIIISVILILIIIDFKKLIKVKAKIFLYTITIIIIVNSFMLIVNRSFYFDEYNQFVITSYYYIFWIICLLIGLLPVIIFLIWLKSKNKKPDILFEYLLLIIAYVMIYIASFLDGVDISIIFNHEILPKITYAVLFLAIVGLLTISYKYKKVVDKVNYYANYDDLTDTFKRKKGIEYIDNLINQRKNTNNNFTVIFFDINNFKKFNDLYDNVFGNIALERISKALKLIIKNHGIICRTGGDEFMFVINGSHKSEKNSKIIKKIIRYFSRSLIIKKISIKVLIKMGISIYPDHGKTTSELLQNANYSLIMVKHLKGKQYLVYNKKIENEKQNVYLIEDKLNNTLNNQNEEMHFMIHYQPKVNSKNKIKGFEALLRWKYYNEYISPDRFIPVAEKSGLIIDIGYFIIKEGCRQLAKWNNNSNINLSINMGIHQLRDPYLFDKLFKNIKMYNIKPGNIEIEITESSIMDFLNDKEIITILNEFNKIGIKISIDDFGTGYSSFSRIIDLPINILKIDKSFIKNLPHNAKSIKVCLSILSLAHELGIKTVAEGVETKEQADFLFKNKCDLIQGYYYYKPMPYDKIDKLLL